MKHAIDLLNKRVESLKKMKAFQEKKPAESVYTRAEILEQLNDLAKAIHVLKAHE